MKRNSTIIIIDTSEIIQNGLVKSLLDKGFSRVFSYSDINHISSIVKEDTVLIINPNNFLYNENVNLKYITDFAKKHSCLLIGLIYGHSEDELRKYFDSFIYLNDSVSSIITKIDNLHIDQNRDDKSLKQNSILSEREKDVVRLIALGFSNKEIANSLNISIHTAISHRKNITTKLDVKSSSAITIYALINKIISEEDFNKSV